MQSVMPDETATVTRPAPRSDLDLEIDRIWRVATLCEDDEVALKHWAKHADLVRHRAAQRQVD
jgi:hypothetical protein